MTRKLFFGTAIAAAALALISQAQSATDPYFDGRVLEFGLGVTTPLNTLQDTLTTPNGGGATVQLTDILDFGTGGRAEIGYSQMWGTDSRLIVNLTGSRTIRETTISIAGAGETFPGTFDDGFLLPTGFTLPSEVEAETFSFLVGREWLLTGPRQVSGGLRYATVSQDFSAASFDAGGTLSRNLSVDSANEMYGIFGGISHYTMLNQQTSIWVNADLGLYQNGFDYAYRNVDAAGIVDQTIDASQSNTVLSTQLSVTVEHGLGNGTYLTGEIGYEGWHGVGNGLDTFLDVGGTAATAVINQGSIQSAYLSVGLFRRF